MKQLGALVPIVTPCSRAGRPDIGALKAVCKYMLEAGCAGIFVGGSTGRGPWFSRKDRARICRAAAEQIGPETPLFAGCMASGLPEMLENARGAADAGARVAVVTGPYYFNYSQQEIEAILLKFADYSPLPVMIYDIPVFAGAKLETKTVGRLARHEKIIGLKDSSADFVSFQELVRNLGNITDFYLIQGKEHLLADSILAGASGMTVSLIHIDPRPFVALYGAASSGNAELAGCLQGHITEVMGLLDESFRRRPETSTLFHFLNCALRRRGVCDNILLGHEGECPGWLAEHASRAMEICQSACS